MSNSSGSDGGGGREHPLAALGRADLDLIVELVLQSGSLKGLARSYGVSYPTIRGRVNKVIARLRDAVEGREPDPLRELLASLVERGELTTAGARRIHDAAREQASHGQHSPGASASQTSVPDISTPPASIRGASTQGEMP